MIFMAADLFSQNISISDQQGQTADPSAVLDVSSTSKGLLVPRMTESQRAAISSPAIGLMVYQTDVEEGFYYYSGSAKNNGWVSVSSSTNSPWAKDPSGNILHTRDLTDSVGVGTSDPGSLLSVNGAIEAMEEGFMFPDGTMQTSAADFNDEGGGADGRWVIGLYCQNIQGSWSIQTCDQCSKVIKFDIDGYYDVGGAQGRYVITKFDVYKNIDAATVEYIKKQIQGQVIGDIRIKFYWVQPQTGTYEEYYRIELTDAKVYNVRQTMFYTAKDTWAHLDVISFMPGAPGSEIRWEYLDGGITFEVPAGYIITENP